MLQTGNIFTDILSIVSVLFPLLPAGIIFLKKTYRNEALNFLMILCLLNFVKNLLLFVPQLNTASQNVFTSIFTLLEFVLLIQIFKQVLPEEIKRITNIFLIAFLSVIITSYLLESTNQRFYALEIVKNIIIIFLGILCLARVIVSSNLNILNEPLFWIITGSLFYFSISILMYAFSWYYAQMTRESMIEKEILIGIGSMVKYFFYTLAALFYQPPSHEHQDPSSI
jgi:hypothetical protein